MKPHHYIFTLLLVACSPSKDADSNISPGAEVNFFNAAEGISVFPGTKAVYINVMDTTQANPVQFTDRNFAGETFPALTIAGPSGTAPILSMIQSSGEHRFIYTNGKRQVMADTAFNLSPAGKHTFYAYDDADSLLYRCRILHIVENASAGTNECRFRVLHFGNDLGEMNCYFIKEDGTRSFPANLPQKMAYSNYSDLIKLDPAVVGQDGNAYLQFFSGMDTTTVKATATIPYRNGRTYAVVVKGLAQVKFVQYKDPADPDHPVQILLNPSIVARVRTVN